MKKTLSIIIPCFNCESTIERCIMSIPTLSSIDIIAVNDGSTDNTLKALKKIKSDNIDKNIIIVNKENGGVSTARNIGIDNCKSEWVCFLDSDDYYNNDEFLSMFNMLNNSRLDVINFSGCRVFDDGRIIPILKSEFEKTFVMENGLDHFLKYDDVMNYINWGPCLHFYRLDIINNNDIRFISNRSFGEDVIFNMEYFINVKKVFSSSSNVYNYYQSDKSLTRNGYNERLFDEITNYVNDIKTICKKYDIKEYEENLKNFYLFQFQFLIMNESRCSDKKTAINKLKKYIKFYDIKNVKFKSLNKMSKISLLLINTRLYYGLYYFLYLMNRGARK